MSKIVKDFLYEEESYAIRGACFEVWKQFKGMFKESVVDKALTIVWYMILRGLKIQRLISVHISVNSAEYEI